MKYTTRDLFWLTLVAALVLFWWQDRQRLIRYHEMDLKVQSELDRVSGEIIAGGIKDATQKVLDKFKVPKSTAPSN